MMSLPPDHGYFDSVSPFARDRLSRAQTPEEARIRLEEIADQHPRKEAAAPKPAGPPVHHWQHDLETMGILLDEHEPDVDRVQRLIVEIQREMDRWV